MRTLMPAGRWMKWALLVSLAVNVAILAAVIGALATDGPDRRSGGGDRRAGGGPPEIAALARGLDDADRRILFEELRASNRVAGERDRMTAARDTIAATLRAEPFDGAAFEAAMQAQRDLQAAAAAGGTAVLSRIIADLTPEQRTALADRMLAVRRPRN